MYDLTIDFGTIRHMKTKLSCLLSFSLFALSASAVDADSFSNPTRSCRPETSFRF
jgi:hypothetical protein